MRVLLASDHFPPFIGGAHRWAGLLASGLARRGHDVVVATAWHRGHARLEHYDGQRVPVHRVRQLRTPITSLVRGKQQRHIPPFADPLTVRDLRRVISEARPDVALSHGWIGFSMVKALKNSDIPLALSAHDYSYFCATRRLLYRGELCSGPALGKCLECSSEYYGPGKGAMAVAGVFRSRRMTERHIAGLQSVTSFVEETLERHLLRTASAKARVRRFVVPPFVDVDPTGTEEEQREIAGFVEKLPEEPFIMFAGAFRLDKGLEVLFDAYRRLKDPPPLVLMGTIERDTPDPLPDFATVLTDVPHAAVMEAWKRALIGVAPSLLPEPLGTVTVEGITYGVPMVATVPGGMVDVLGDGVGILVPQGDAGALAKAMQSLIDDPARRATLSRRGKARSVAFQADVVLSRYEQMLEELVAGAEQAPQTPSHLATAGEPLPE